MTSVGGPTEGHAEPIGQFAQFGQFGTVPAACDHGDVRAPRAAVQPRFMNAYAGA